MDQYKKLRFFEEVAKWDKEAKKEIEKIVGVYKAIYKAIKLKRTELENERKIQSEKSFLKRKFSNPKVANELVALIDNLENRKDTLENMAVKLQESVDFTPDSPEEQKALLIELKQYKKELALKKREINTAMKQIREDARQLSTHAGVEKGFFGSTYYSSTTAERQRRQIRYQRESVLRPQENEKRAIERQLLQVEQDIIWAERFTK
jgi:hypothetical protein